MDRKKTLFFSSCFIKTFSFQKHAHKKNFTKVRIALGQNNELFFNDENIFEYFLYTIIIAGNAKIKLTISI